MVVLQAESDETLNQLLRALADGTRRDILARSLTETPSVSALAARYEMSSPQCRSTSPCSSARVSSRSVHMAASNW